MPGKIVKLCVKPGEEVAVGAVLLVTTPGVVFDRIVPFLVATGSLAPAGADLLSIAMREERSVVVSGATHAGKTTLLAALVADAAPEAVETVLEAYAHARVE